MHYCSISNIPGIFHCSIAVSPIYQGIFIALLQYLQYTWDFSLHYCSTCNILEVFHCTIALSATYLGVFIALLQYLLYNWDFSLHYCSICNTPGIFLLHYYSMCNIPGIFPCQRSGLRLLTCYPEDHWCSSGVVEGNNRSNTWTTPPVRLE